MGVGLNVSSKLMLSPAFSAFFDSVLFTISTGAPVGWRLMGSDSGIRRRACHIHVDTTALTGRLSTNRAKGHCVGNGRGHNGRASRVQNVAIDTIDATDGVAAAAAPVVQPDAAGEDRVSSVGSVDDEDIVTAFQLCWDNTPETLQPARDALDLLIPYTTTTDMSLQTLISLKKQNTDSKRQSAEEMNHYFRDFVRMARMPSAPNDVIQDLFTKCRSACRSVLRL
jgi:hypothetical protein